MNDECGKGRVGKLFKLLRTSTEDKTRALTRELRSKAGPEEESTFYLLEHLHVRTPGWIQVWAISYNKVAPWFSDKSMVSPYYGVHRAGTLYRYMLDTTREKREGKGQEMAGRGTEPKPKRRFFFFGCHGALWKEKKSLPNGDTILGSLRALASRLWGGEWLP